MFNRILLQARRSGLHFFLPCICLAAAVQPVFAHDDDTKSANTGTPPGAIFSTLLPDVPGRRLTVFELKFKPKESERHSRAHRHPGSVYVYVTKGSVRWGIEGRPVQVLHAGDSFFEPAGVLHTVAENASTTEPASVLAVMIVPDGAPLVQFEK